MARWTQASTTAPSRIPRSRRFRCASSPIASPVPPRGAIGSPRRHGTTSPRFRGSWHPRSARITCSRPRFSPSAGARPRR
jgi:hypothetical protein